MARSHARPRLVRTALAALCALAPVWAAARVTSERQGAAIACHPGGADAASSAAIAGRVHDEVGRRARKLRAAARERVARTILDEAARARMDPAIVLAVIQVESGYDPQALSAAGAIGLMQLLVPTMHEEARRSRLVSADPLDPVANVRAGVRYLGRLVASFDDLELALLAYNAGPGRIRRHLHAGAVPRRLLGYTRRIQAELDRLAARWGHPSVQLAAARRPPPALLAAHAAPPRQLDLFAHAAPSIRSGTAPELRHLLETLALALPPDRVARRPAVRTGSRRARSSRRAGRGGARLTLRASRGMGRCVPKVNRARRALRPRR